MKAKIVVPVDADENAIRETALANEQVKQAVGDMNVVKVIVIPKRLVNIVVK